jgi:phosphate-selective porin OprO and OprP
MNGGLRKLSRQLLAGAGAVGFLAAGVTGANAQQDMRDIQAQIDAMQATIKGLQKQVQDAQAQAAAANAAAENAGGSDLDLKVKWKGAPELSSADGKFSFKVRGRLQTDYNAIDQDFDITGRPDVSSAELRRARLGVEGVLFYNVAYKFEVDFANDVTAIKDAYVEYNGLADGLSLRAGNFKTPNSLDEMTSSRFLTFLERAAFVEAWGLDRQIGAGVIYAKDHYTVSAGIFGPEPFEDELFLDDVVTGAARLTLAPINREVNGVHQVVHLGASWRGRQNAEDRRSASNAAIVNPFNDELFRYRARGADLHLADRFVQTPQIFDEDQFWGLEGAVIWGPVHVVGEYTELDASIARDAFGTTVCCSGSDPTYNGWYVEAGAFLTGETRSYKEGEFGRIKVKNPVLGGGKGGGWGAWQIAGRYDVIDLTDKAQTIQNANIVSGGNFLQSLSTSCTLCGEQKTWEIVVNWWLNDYTGLQFQYSQSDIDGGPLLVTTASGAVVSANQNDKAKIEGFGTRLRFDW